ncbi:MAG: exodeoxyribonuclease V subunit alpha [Gammaproteobacteria bacterium]|nr:exodeoxyribonuclease V subunit alpha [Gammaproteobacteria bacterium]NBY22180.1 exodeoxyribonuclease V subunit alpha [Gammaproteobacteria bacterium]
MTTKPEPLEPHLDSVLEQSERVIDLLNDWRRRQWIRPLDLAFSSFLLKECPDAPPLLILSSALLSHQLGRGHVCLDLNATLLGPSEVLHIPPIGEMLGMKAPFEGILDILLKGLTADLWAKRLQYEALISSGAGSTPLVLERGRLYFRRYWAYEKGVRTLIDQRIGLFIDHSDPTLDRELPRRLNSLFQSSAIGPIHWQKIACALAARQGFTIITGGPGTGKTTSVLKLLALLQSIQSEESEPQKPSPRLRIQLAAPTGKAAQRLNTSISKSIRQGAIDPSQHAEKVLEAMPQKALTLHRLLGYQAGSRQFRHNQHHPLPIDVLVIDEASMIDLEMMHAVLLALPANARLILLGDKDQLASVEAGTILGEMCQRAHKGHYSFEIQEWLLKVTGEALPKEMIDPASTPLDQAIVMLRDSHRFKEDSGIGALGRTIRDGDLQALHGLWGEGYRDIAVVQMIDNDIKPLQRLVIEGQLLLEEEGRYGYRHYLETLHQDEPSRDAHPEDFSAWALKVLEAHSAFQVLAGVRKGAFGVDALNTLIAESLHQEGLLSASDGWYLGRPVMVIRNDYALGLMNGDIGITLRLPVEGGGSALRVAFPNEEGTHGVRWVLPSRLRDVETVFALTVHKSQGSEFAHTALILPPHHTGIMTRELLYTGVTRASEWFTLVHTGDQSILQKTVLQRVERHSGLIAHG